ncbi:hypothetical protein COCON_G00124580 [Conger conger]|uniref:Interleukin-6 n=1 Tax=Conger conger TaxID=82655 RepID=A0A9Q1DCQ9_CONCO|nr:hypothetical protein COCON_G00124580 [Conger conger]
MPSAQRSRTFYLLLLCACARQVTAAPYSSAGGETLEISGDEVPDPPKTFPSTKWEPLTYELFYEVSKLHDQQFVEEFDEPKENMSNYKDNKLALPNVAECSSSNFSKDTCLLRISTGLQLHALYLQFVQQEYSNSVRVPYIKSRTKALADHVTEIMKSSKHAVELSVSAREELLRALPAGSEWERKITVHVLLREFRSFLMATVRALRHIELRGRRKHTPKAEN